MTKLQALFILYLRHEEFCGYSWRFLASNYCTRYKGEEYNGYGNQIKGMNLEEEAFKILIPDPLFMEPVDLFECDLTRVKANLKRHIK